MTLTVAFANSGEMQIELIQQRTTPRASTPSSSPLDGHGFHQLAYWTTDFEATMREVEKAGWPVVWSGGDGDGVRFAYVEPPGGPAAVIEISELTDATSAMATFVRDAAVEWDGSDPIRVLGA